MVELMLIETFSSLKSGTKKIKFWIKIKILKMKKAEKKVKSIRIKL